MGECSITILTASHMNLSGLKKIYVEIESVLIEKCRWIVKDSGYCEDTFKWINDLNNPNITFAFERDSGIYDALNFCIKKCKSEFYIVVGTDDFIFRRSLLEIISNVESGKYNDADVVVFPVIKSNKIVFRNYFAPLNLSISRIISSHSVGAMIRSNLHKRFGFYDVSYKILADSFFIRKIKLHKVNFMYESKLIAGIFGAEGISSVSHKLRVEEAYKYNIELGSNKLIQKIYRFLRKCKYRI